MADYDIGEITGIDVGETDGSLALEPQQDVGAVSSLNETVVVGVVGFRTIPAFIRSIP